MPSRFWARVQKSDGCWLWTGGRKSKGYGSLGHARQTLQAHRLAYEFTYGKIPDGLAVLHTCDNPPCVRPDHLFLGTHLDNSRDMIAKGRGRWRGLPGEECPSARLTRAQVEEIRSRYQRGEASQDELAMQYGVSQSNISIIVLGKSWRSVSQDPALPERDRRARGERCSGAKLTAEAVRRIRERYAEGGGTYAQIALDYGMSERQISLVVLRKAWKHVT